MRVGRRNEDKRIHNNDSDFVLLDRYYDASIAYQGYGRGIPLDFIENLIKLIECPKPDVSFLFDLSVEDSISRKKLDVKDRIESSGESGSIQVTTFTYQVLKNKYIFEERGIITVKGKGRMVTYCLQEKK